MTTDYVLQGGSLSGQWRIYGVGIRFATLSQQPFDHRLGDTGKSCPLTRVFMCSSNAALLLSVASGVP